jgi:hypothetical protein
MHGQDHLRSLKKFSAIALVLTLGAAFHGLCWSSLVRQSGVLEQPALSCTCVQDQRFGLIHGREIPKSCEQDGSETLLARP